MQNGNITLYVHQATNGHQGRYQSAAQNKLVYDPIVYVYLLCAIVPFE